jgi:hypothetical protein
VKCNPVAKAADQWLSANLAVASGCAKEGEALTHHPERAPDMHGGLSPVRHSAICEYIASDLDRKVRLEHWLRWLAYPCGVSHAC